VTLRWRPNENTTVYGDLSRGFRSGGFNQSGVALAGVAGVFNTFDEQIADTLEIGWKGQFADGRLSTNVAYYTTDAEGAYYFIFLVASSTQNLGSLDQVDYSGIEFELNALLTDTLSLNLGVAVTDSEIKADASLPHVRGQEAPLTSDYTFNLGFNYAKPLDNNLEFVWRTDLHGIGDTYWGPGDPANRPIGWNQTVRDPVEIVDMRLGVQAEDWSVMFWSKNLFDEEYNDEYSHPFVWKALPRRWGVQYTKNF
jgi:iron complex outermembrane receptor protein